MKKPKKLLNVQPKAESIAPRQMNPASPTPAAAPKRARVALELVKPGANRVYVAGSFNQWKPDQTPLAPMPDGRWVGELTVSPGKYEYLFVVDGQWVVDPRATETVQNPYGGRNAVLTIAA